MSTQLKNLETEELIGFSIPGCVFDPHGGDASSAYKTLASGDYPEQSIGR